MAKRGKDWEDDYYRSDEAKEIMDVQIRHGVSDPVFVHEFLAYQNLLSMAGKMSGNNKHSSNREPLRLFTFQEACKWLEIDYDMIKKIALDKGLGVKETGKTLMFSLEDMNEIRKELKTIFPNRYCLGTQENPKRKPIVINVAMFKGGVGKTTTSIHLSMYLAMRGYRVCLVDTDPQASSTNFFGILPYLDIDSDNLNNATVQGLFVRSADEKPWEDLIIRKTHWPTIDIVPSHEDMYGIESRMKEDPSKGHFYWDFVKNAVDGGRFIDYDIVLIDTPPASNAVTVSFAFASDILLMPIQPVAATEWTQYDFNRFLAKTYRIAEQTNGSISRLKYPLLIPSIIESQMTEIVKQDLDAMSKTFSGKESTIMLPCAIHRRFVVTEAATRFSTIFETDALEVASRKAEADTKKMFENAFYELIPYLKKIWQQQDGE